jgi:hypothetical protein
MTDIHAKKLRRLAKNRYASDILCSAADRIEKLQARVLLLEGYLRGSLDVIDRFVACDTRDAHVTLESNP